MFEGVDYSGSVLLILFARCIFRLSSKDSRKKCYTYCVLLPWYMHYIIPIPHLSCNNSEVNHYVLSTRLVAVTTIPQGSVKRGQGPVNALTPTMAPEIGNIYLSIANNYWQY